MPTTLTARKQDPPKPWDRLRDETGKAFRAFCLYRDDFEGRTLEKVAKALSCSQQNVARWAKVWDWAARSYAYDSYMDELNRAEQVRERRAMRRRQAEAGVLLQEVATEGLAELERRMARGQPLNLSVDQICRLAEVGSRIERKARGEDSPQSRYSKIEVIIAESLKEYGDDAVAGQNL